MVHFLPIYRLVEHVFKNLHFSGQNNATASDKWMTITLSVNESDESFLSRLNYISNLLK